MIAKIKAQQSGAISYGTIATGIDPLHS